MRSSHPGLHASSCPKYHKMVSGKLERVWELNSCLQSANFILYGVKKPR